MRIQRTLLQIPGACEQQSWIQTQLQVQKLWDRDPRATLLHLTVRHLSYSECHNTPQTAGAVQAEFHIYHNPREYLVSTGYTAKRGKWNTGHHTALPVTGTPHSHLNILVMYWGGPEAEEVTEPMSAMCGATHSFRISCKERPRLSSPRQPPQFHSPSQTAAF